jgi:transglutaminase-like putative cysteine protease
MAPGSINFLAFSSSVVARAEFSDQIPHARQRYFRALILNHFDGMVWTKGWERENPKTAMEHAVNASSLVRCRITVEAEHTHYLPALDLPLAVSPNAVLHPGFLVRPKRRTGDEFRYRLRSALRYHTRSDVGPEFSLQIPESGLEKSRESAAEWKDRSPEEIVQSGLDFIRRQGLTYTLSPPLLEDDPVDRFLFETKQGYCEHFASAFAVLMRLAGVPSRIVIGFQGGEINPLTDFLVLRASDAHAWCEVWIQDKGWIRVDPTSVVSPDRVELGMQAVFPQADLPLLAQGDAPRFVVDGIRGFRLGLDAVNTFWQQWVLEYSGRRQMELLQKIHAGGNTFLQILIRIGLVLAGGLAVFVPALLWRNRPRKDSDLVKRSRQKFRKKLAAAEVKVPDWAGPETIQQMVIRHRPDLAHDTQKILMLYTALSFGRNPDPEDAKRLWERVRSWRPAPRSAYNTPGQDRSQARR